MPVREAMPADAEAFASVRLRSWQVAYRGLVPDDRLAALDLDAWVEQARETLSRAPGGSHQLVSVDADGAVVATAACGPARDPVDDATGELYLLYADPDVWGDGHGHALLEEVHVRLRAAGHDAALLWVAEGNDRALGFYAAHGWQLDGTTTEAELWGITIAEVRMRRALR